jgi:hypothetical protein
MVMKKGLILTLAPSLAAFLALSCSSARAADDYQYKDTRELVALVKDAARAMFTSVSRSFTVTFLLPSQSPTQEPSVTVGVGVEVGLKVAVGPTTELYS